MYMARYNTLEENLVVGSTDGIAFNIPNAYQSVVANNRLSNTNNFLNNINVIEIGNTEF